MWPHNGEYIFTNGRLGRNSSAGGRMPANNAEILKDNEPYKVPLNSMDETARETLKYSFAIVLVTDKSKLL